MSSRLSLMQARFQQKQMQEREEKLLRLYENQQQRAIERVNRGSAGSNTSVSSLTGTNMATHGGKVRQMFDERRQKAGIDRSYPLEPLRSKKISKGMESGLVNGKRAPTKVANRNTVVQQRTVVVQGRNAKTLIGRQQAPSKTYYDFDGPEYYQENGYNDSNGNKSYKNQTIESLMHKSHISDSIQDESFPEYGIDDLDEPIPMNIVNVKLANVGGILPSQNEKLAKSNVERIVTVNPRSPAGGTAKKPVPNVKTITKASSKKPVERRITSESVNQTSSPIRSPEMMQQRAKGNEPQQRPQSSRSNKSPHPTQRAPSESRPARSPKGPPPAVARDDLESCKYCSRRFAADRLQLHEDICSKTSKKKRKTYDATKHRVQGTELEPFVRKVGKAPSKVSSKPSESTMKSDWRRKHEDFISAIRAAKQAQAYVAKGGKLTDLPPPPPSYNPDYVQCPHCDRRFNQQAADRHIPKCANYQFNKRKPGAKPSSRAR